MQITTNSSSYWQRITPQQTQKAEESQDFASRLSVESPKTSIIQKQTQEFPQGLLQDIENLSSLMLDFDNLAERYTSRKFGGVGYIYSNNNGNTSFVLGGYEYVVSKVDENLSLDDLKHISGFGTHFNVTAKDNIQNGIWLGDDSYIWWINDDFDKTRYRPISSSIIYDPETSDTFSPKPEAFPEELNRQPDMGYTYSDFESNLRVIEKLLDKHLLAAYEKNPRSDETQQLLFLKAKVNTISEVIEKDREIVIEHIQLDSTSTWTQGLFSHQDLWANQTAMLAEFSLNLNKFLSENEQQQVIDSLQVILNYSDHHWFEGFGTQISSLFKNDNAMSAQLKASAQDFRENLVSRLSAIDNTETLLNLTSDSMSLQNHAKESKSYESLIDTIRAKLKTTDDSILQKLMNGKIANQAKAAEASA